MNNNQSYMKIIIGLLLTFFAFELSAQGDPSGRKHPSVSKGVQHVQLKDDFYAPASVATGNAATISKGVQRINLKPSSKGKVRMTGTPMHVISKDVARMQVRQ
jgi:hypothetical protein